MMLGGARGVRYVMVAAGVALLGWVGARALTGNPRPVVQPVQAPVPVSDASYDSATVELQGAVTPAARTHIMAAVGGDAAVVVLLGRDDHRVCEDLGRQLRELRFRADPRLPIVVTTAPGSADDVRRFLRRERVRVTDVVALAPDYVFDARGKVPTPAVVVTRDGGVSASGVGHPRRFSNVRIRSFADELSAWLGSAAEPGGSSSTSARRLQ